MAQKISKRLQEIMDALPLRNGLRILEIGCGSGVVAREIVNRFDNVFVLGIDRSAKAISQAKDGSAEMMKSDKLKFQQVAIEDFELPDDQNLFDFAFAIRVGALDGRHPELEARALPKIREALKKNGRLFIDGGNPLKEIKLTRG